MKYSLVVTLHNFNLKHAGNKAVTDCELILHKRGFRTINLTFDKSPYFIGFSLIKLFTQLSILAISIKPNSLIVTQYPIIGVNRFFAFFIGLLRHKKCRFACLIHDINALRYQLPEQAVQKEIDNLNKYDVIISHNKKMTEWLKAKGLIREAVTLKLFDYLYTNENNFNRVTGYAAGRKKITFAGNLNRGRFIFQLKVLPKLQFDLYGPTDDPVLIQQQRNVSWKGLYGPEKLVSKLGGNFGLVWDGDDIEDCTGQFGDYIRYNNPHKISLYIAAGLPVIIPSKAALCPFVIKENIGIAINSLYDLYGEINKINTEQYETMVQNIFSIKNKLKTGYYFNAALEEIENNLI